MKIERFNKGIEAIGMMALGACLIDEIAHRGWIGWILVIAACWCLHVILDDRSDLRHEMKRRDSL